MMDSGVQLRRHGLNRPALAPKAAQGNTLPPSSLLGFGSTAKKLLGHDKTTTTASVFTQRLTASSRQKPGTTAA
jgi:hypothetical protein